MTAKYVDSTTFQSVLNQWQETKQDRQCT